MEIQPFGDRIAIKILSHEDVTECGLIVSVSKEKSNKGTVVAMGEEANEYIHIGDTVIFNKGTGLSYTNGNDDYLILSSKEVLGKII